MATAAALALSLTACGSADSSDGGKNANGALDVWGFFELAPQAWEEFTEATGIKVNYSTVPWGDYQVKLNTVLGTKDQPDIVLLERSFVGKYLTTDYFLDIEAEYGDDPAVIQYLQDTNAGTKDPATVDGSLKGVGWESGAGVYYYRQDLAEKCLGITTVEEMEAAIETEEKFATLQAELNKSSCSGIKTIADINDYYGAQYGSTWTTPVVTGKTLTVPKSYRAAAEAVKTAWLDTKIAYTQNDRTAQINGALSDAYLGTVSPSWGVQAISEYGQDGLWRIALSPFKYTSGGTWMGITNDGDTDIAMDFMKMTFMNQDWLVNNMSTFGSVGNKAVMDKYIASGVDNTNPSFGNQNIIAKLAEADARVEKVQPATQYDAGVSAAMDNFVNGFIIDGTFKTYDDAMASFVVEMGTIYPELTVVIE